LDIVHGLGLISLCERFEALKWRSYQWSTELAKLLLKKILYFFPEDEPDTGQ